MLSARFPLSPATPRKGGTFGKSLPEDHGTLRGGLRAHRGGRVRVGGLSAVGFQKLQAPVRGAGSRPRPEARRDGGTHLRWVANALRSCRQARVEGDRGFRRAWHGEAAILLRRLRHRSRQGRAGGEAVGCEGGGCRGGRRPRAGGGRRRRGRPGRSGLGGVPQRSRGVLRLAARARRRGSRVVVASRGGGPRAVRGVCRRVPMRARAGRVSARLGHPPSLVPVLAGRDRRCLLCGWRRVVTPSARGGASRVTHGEDGAKSQTCETGAGS